MTDVNPENAMTRVTVLFLGPAREWTGTSCEVFELSPPACLSGLRSAVCRRFPAMAAVVDHVRFAVNEAFAADDVELHNGDEVAVIPPVSGGCETDAIWVDLTREPIDVARVRRFTGGDPTCGAVNTFDGVSRAERDAAHGSLVHLHYEAYPPMAVKQMRAIAEQARQRFGAARVAIVHRIGDVPVGEVSVSIAVACPPGRGLRYLSLSD